MTNLLADVHSAAPPLSNPGASLILVAAIAFIGFLLLSYVYDALKGDDQ